MQSPHETALPPIAHEPPPAHDTFCPERRRRYVLIAAILASSLGFIDGSVVSIAMPAIRADIGATLSQAQWISNGYALMLSALILVGGALGDRAGLRRSFAAGIALFIVASLLCAAAPTPTLLIAARTLQGVGAAIMVPGSLAIIAKAYPKAERGRAIGIWAASSALTTALGPVLGGIVLSAFDDAVWRWIFAINLPLGGIALYLLIARVPPDAAAPRRELDIGGGLLAMASLGSIALGLTLLSGEAKIAGLDVPTLLIAGGSILIVLFLLWEARHPAPMIELALFRARSFSGANLATFFLYFALSAILFYLPMMLIAGWGIEESTVGFLFLPLSASIALLSGPVGKVSDRIGPRVPMAAGSLLVGVSFAALGWLANAGIHQFWGGVFPMMLLMGLGMSLVVSPLSIAVMTSIDDKDTGAASGINNAVSRIAGLVAVAALGSVAAIRFASVAAGAEVPEFGETPAAGLAADLERLRVEAGDRAFAAVAWVAASGSFLAAIISWLTAPGKSGSEPGSEPAETPAG
ncbi:MFS transporter [Mesorhizobium sp. Z1-4]|uniref:MFS transporter n=1 Tax=Mesorhizobium sp. Z1-4 TaxID=2448478 RepID=UPI000FD8A7E7|nr:MFS transporter [Mesorhizobium sp. Z1-4]